MNADFMTQLNLLINYILKQYRNTGLHHFASILASTMFNEKSLLRTICIQQIIICIDLCMQKIFAHMKSALSCIQTVEMNLPLIVYLNNQRQSALAKNPFSLSVIGKTEGNVSISTVISYPLSRQVQEIDALLARHLYPISNNLSAKLHLAF